MGLLLKFIMLGVVAYGVWNTARRWLNVLGGDRVKAPPPGPPPVPPRAPSSAPAGPVQSVRRPIIEDTRAWHLRCLCFGLRCKMWPSGLPPSLIFQVRCGA